MEMMTNKGIGIKVKREICERITILAVTYVQELCSKKVTKRQKMNVFEMKYLRNTENVTRRKGKE